MAWSYSSNIFQFILLSERYHIIWYSRHGCVNIFIGNGVCFCCIVSLFNVFPYFTIVMPFSGTPDWQFHQYISLLYDLAAVFRHTPTGSVSQSQVSSGSKADPTIHHVPFAFNLMGLIPKCQQVELLFSTYRQGNNTSNLGIGTTTQCHKNTFIEKKKSIKC